MQPGLSEVAGDVEADPGAVLEAHGAESVDELVTEGASDRGSQDGASAERDADSDRAVSRLFESGLDRPEQRSGTPTEGTTPSGETPPSDRTRESTTTPEVLGDLERAIEATAEETSADLDPADLDTLEDGDVEDALAAAEQLDDATLPESVPEEWR
jgi:hypothetical protein